MKVWTYYQTLGKTVFEILKIGTWVKRGKIVVFSCVQFLRTWNFYFYFYSISFIGSAMQNLRQECQWRYFYFYSFSFIGFALFPYMSLTLLFIICGVFKMDFFFIFGVQHFFYLWNQIEVTTQMSFSKCSCSAPLMIKNADGWYILLFVTVSFILYSNCITRRR